MSITDADLDRAAKAIYMEQFTDDDEETRAFRAMLWDAGPSFTREHGVADVRRVVSALEAVGLTVARLTPAVDAENRPLWLDKGHVVPGFADRWPVNEGRRMYVREGGDDQ